MKNDPVCYKCKTSISDHPIIAFSRFWHKNCFVCVQCHRPLDHATAILVEDFLFHVSCDPKKKNVRVNTSPKPDWLSDSPSVRKISRSAKKSNYISALESICCPVCNKSFGEQFYIHRGNSFYHKDCFTSNHILICDICCQPISGEYTIDSWGNAFCKKHQPKYCDECGRAICQEITGGSLSYQDGRTVCNICHQTAVDSPDKIRKSMNRVRDILGKNGLLIDESMFPVLLVNCQEMAAISQKPGNFAGLFCPAQTHNGQRRIEAVYVLWGKPDYSFEGILAHELGHAWFYVNRVDWLDQQLAEGLCNILQYLIQIQTELPIRLHTLQSLFRDKNPIYGEGFRLAEQHLHEYTVGALMRYVAKNHSLPPLRSK